MKIRTGYVSNSSTTSFAILIKPEKAKDIEFILRHVKAWNGEPCQTVPERKKDLKKEVRELGKDMTFIDDLVEKVNRITKEETVAHRILEQVSSFHVIRSMAIRNSRLYSSPFGLSLGHYKETLRTVKKSLREDLVEHNKQLKLLEGNEDWSVITFEEDLNWGTLRGMVDELVEKGDAVILIRDTT